MKAVCLLENFKKSINLASRFISNKTQLPILKTILLQVIKNKIILSATNLENSVSLEFPCKAEKDGEIAVDARILFDLLNNLKSENLEIEVDKEQVKLSSLNFKAEIAGVNTSDFPRLPKINFSNQIALKKEDFNNYVSKILFSVSQDESRPILTGVLFKFKDDSLTLVSTDSFRLTEIKFKNNQKTKDSEVVIPKAILNEIIKISDGDYIYFSYDQDNKQVFFKIEDVIFSSKIIEGSFPDYQKIIPKSSEFEFFADKEELANLIRLAAVFSRDSGNIMKLIVDNTKLVIKAESSTAGNEEGEIGIRSENNIKNFQIMFNYKFVEDVLKVIEDDEVKVSITGRESAAIFSDPKDTNFLHLVMPIKSQD